MPDNRKPQRDDKKVKQPQTPKTEPDRDEDQIVTQRNPRMDDDKAQDKDNSEPDLE